MSSDSPADVERFVDEVLACAAAFRQWERAPGTRQQVSLAQQTLLRLLKEEPGLTVSQLARRRGLSRQSVQVHMDRLVSLGWVRLVANPDHQRSARVQLTDTGRRALSSPHRRRFSRLADRLPALPTGALRECAAVLHNIRSNLGGRQPVAGVGRRRQRTHKRPVEASQPVPSPAEATSPESEATDEVSPLEGLPVSLL